VGDVGYTCETADYFYLEHIQSRIEKFHLDVSSVSQSACSNAVAEAFPFSAYFSSAPQPLFTLSFDADMEVAEGCFRHIKNAFTELADYRAFELLRTQAHRADYLLTKQVMR
jgi:intron-binding protein aquarius